MAKQAQVMVIAPHPDDTELGVAGTVAHWVAEGKNVIYVVCVFRTKSAGISEQIGHPNGLNRPPSRSKSATSG